MCVGVGASGCVAGVHCALLLFCLSHKRTYVPDYSLDQKSPHSPDVPKQTTTPQSIPPHLAPGPGYEDVEMEAVGKPRREAYDNVKLEGLLPPELRTRENLEGPTLSPEEVEKIRELERRKEQKYEDVAMRREREDEVVSSVRLLSKPPGGQEGAVQEGEYYNPADALKDEQTAVLRKGSGNRPSEEGKRFKVGTPQSQDFVPGSYTEVFDQLPTGETAVVGHKKADRGFSDSSPLIERKTQGHGAATAARRVDPVGYEDMPEDIFKTTSASAPSHESPLSASMGNIADDLPSSPREQPSKTEVSKRYSHPARRNTAKEMVEINPRSRKPVTLSSQRKKQLLNEVDGEGGAESPGMERNDVTNGMGAGSKSVEPSPTTKPKSFSVSSEASTQDSYAMVDVAGKTRYRAESDATRKEGCGTPDHYTVKERPPEVVDGTPQEVSQM